MRLSYIMKKICISMIIGIITVNTLSPSPKTIQVSEDEDLPIHIIIQYSTNEYNG